MDSPISRADLADIKHTANSANDHPIVQALARAGYAASGLMHLLIGWIAVGIATRTGGRGETADQSGALAQLADTGWGRPLLWVMVAGFFGLALWQLTETIGGWHGRGREAAMSRIKAGSKAVVYAALGLTSLTFARGGTASSGSQSAKATDTLLDAPGGRLLVAVVGLVVLGVGGYHVYKGAQKKFRQDLVGEPPRPAIYAGIVGYVAKGIALVVLGGLFLVAAMRGNAEQVRGLDGAFRAIASSPAGTAALLVVGLGIMAYGIYSFFRARYTKV